MYKIFVGMIVSMMVVSTFSGKGMDRLPGALPAPQLIEEREQERKIAELNKDLLSREKYMRCKQLFYEESNEDSKSLNSRDDLRK